MSMHANRTQVSSKESPSNLVESPQVTVIEHDAFYDNSTEAIHERSLQKIADQSPQVQHAAQLQALTDNDQVPVLQKAEIEGEEVPQTESFLEARKSHTSSPPNENSTGLPDNLKSGIEHLSGFAMNDVKVHYNSPRPSRLQALAYAQGTDIHIAPGQDRHLPHEAWHVVQQKQGRVKPTLQMKGNVNVNDDPGLEKEADQMGKMAESVNPGLRSPIKSESLADSGSKSLPRQFTNATIQRRDPENVMVTGISHIVKLKDRTIFEGDEERPIYHGQQVVIDRDIRIRSRRGPNQETFREEDRFGPQHYRWFKVIAIDGIVVKDNRYIREDVFVALDENLQANSDNTKIVGMYLGNVNFAQNELAAAQAEANQVMDPEQADNKPSKVLGWWYNNVNGNTQTTPEAGFPALLTLYGDASTQFGGLHEHVQGRGDKLRVEAEKSALEDSSMGDLNLSNAAAHATGVADSLAVFGESYKTIKALHKLRKAETKAAKHRQKGKVKSSSASAGIAALNAAKYFAIVAGAAMGGAIVGGIASMASYCRSLYQMGEAEGQYLDLRHIKLKGNHARLGELIKYAKGKKGRRTVYKAIATTGAAVSASLSAGAIAALAISGAAAAAALAVTPVGLALGGIALIIGLGLTAYRIARWVRKKRRGKQGIPHEREKWTEYLHEKINSSPNFLQKDALYKKDVCIQVIEALGLTAENCKGSDGKKNIFDALES